ncbi:hypothetical protein AcV5_003261 [Taiwanofungus camphoratus]|nr:hypothetical protein AcV5_003261 [Antrodia cinnamomea]KAI0929389.1 hypothetical protein AcV7_005256 [Antrodia cinnamomea]
MASPTTIFEISLLQLRGKVIDITSNGTATPGRFRLLDCEKLTQGAMWTRKLCVDEFSSFPPDTGVPYATLSYVWRGNPIPRNSDASWGRFNVEGAAQDSDPIGIAILAYACEAAWNKGYKYLWIDRLCIIQNNRSDKAYQISNMFAIYKRCNVCLILPGGIQRLVPLQEETEWITRAWTLQEAVAPPEAYVLFDNFDWKWKHGWSKTNVEEVLSYRCAMAPLKDILANAIPLATADGDPPAIIRNTKGDATSSESARVQLIVLWGAMNLKGAAREQAIWRSSMMRTSSRPVDMIFSIMGLFGVTLDTHVYGQNDRLLATRALAQVTLRNGRPANWLAISFFLPPSSQISTFPDPPQTSLLNGEVRLGYTLKDSTFVEVAGIMYRGSDAKWWLDDMPAPASMDDAGYLTFSSRAAPLTFVENKVDHFSGMTEYEDTSTIYITATDGTVWEIPRNLERQTQGFKTFVVSIGKQCPWGEVDRIGDRAIGALVVEEHAPKKFHVRSWCRLGNTFHAWMMNEWPLCSFDIGGSGQEHVPKLLRTESSNWS